MKKYLVVLMALLVSSNLYAKESGFSLSTALVGMSMDYREYDDNNVILDSEKSTSNTGALFGPDLGFSYTKVLESGNYAELGVHFMIVSGETEYVGALFTSGEGYGSYRGTTKNIVFDTDIDYRFTHVFNSGFSLNYGMGVGYRSWRRELSSVQIEDYKWVSLRPQIGVLYTISMFSVGLDLEYQYGLNPKMTILADSENPDTTVNLGGANIIQICVPFTFSVHENVDLFIEYIYENQIIDKSDTAPYLYYDKYGQLKNGMIHEPKSTANNSYAKFGAVFKF